MSRFIDDFKRTSSALLAGGIVLFVLGLARPAFTDEYDQFSLAKNAFDAGEYQEAVKRFDALLKQGLQNPSLIIETHKLIAISYLFTGNEAMAENHFNKLLTRAPDFALDPLLYPIEVIDFFTKIKQKSKKQLEALAKAKAIEAAKRKAEEEEKRKAEAEKLKRNVYIEREIYKGSVLVAALPFGAGQFQNGDKVKGYIFLSSELLLTAAGITFYFLHAGLRDDAESPFESSERRQTYELREKVYRIGNQASIGTLGVVTTIGIIDALLRFRKEQITWKKVNEEDVPYEMRPKQGGEKKITFGIQSDRESFGISIEGRF